MGCQVDCNDLNDCDGVSSIAFDDRELEQVLFLCFISLESSFKWFVRVSTSLCANTSSFNKFLTTNKRLGFEATFGNTVSLQNNKIFNGKYCEVNSSRN